jgi:hypothetical protein
MFKLSVFPVTSLNAGEKCTILIKALPVGFVVRAIFSSGVVLEHDHNRPLILAANIRIKDIFFFIVLIL